MPFKEPDPADPNMLVGVMLPADAGAMRDMAYVFAEEFARLGYSREQLLWLFKNPFYGGAHGTYRTLGEEQILSIIDECMNVWGQTRFSILDCGFALAGEDHNSNLGSNIEFRGNVSAIQNPKSKIQNGGSEE